MTAAETGRRYDVAIIGGGAAGLAGALTLARARRSVLVIDAGRPRNAPAEHVHTYLGREGTPPQTLLAQGRTEVIGYGGEIRHAEVVTADRDGEGFRLALRDASAGEGTSTVTAARLLVATGLRDELPPVPGIEERWGRDVLHCPYCHGWEVRDRAIGVLGTGPLAVHQALLWRQWSPAVTLFLHTAPAPGPEAYEQLAARDITVVEGQVTGLETRDDRLAGVRLDGGRTLPCEALAITPRFTARAEPLAGLGVRTAEQEMNGHVVGTHVPADRSGATEVPGVWVAGNVADLAEQVIGAAAAGVRAGAAINADLIAEETRRAVSTRRAATTQASAHAGHSGTAGQDGAGEEFWDARYRESDRIWSGEPNAALVREVTDLEPGTVLDLGCGEGADAIWLARRGWKVTAVDISGVALERAARYAVAEGVEGIDWQRHDLASSWPEGEYDLVSAHFLHSPGDMPRESILRRATAAVAPGGVLLVVGHAGFPPWEHDHPHVPMPTPQEVLDGLSLDGDEWKVERCEEHERTQTGPDGRPAIRTDGTLRVRRVRGGPGR